MQAGFAALAAGSTQRPMRFVVQVISSHAVFATSILETLVQDPRFAARSLFALHLGHRRGLTRARGLSSRSLLPRPAAQPALSIAPPQTSQQQICLFDFPEQAQEEYMLNLFFAGVEGIVCLRQRWAGELRRVVRNVLNGQLCIPPLVLQKYAKETNSLLEADSSLNKLLTAREVQVAHLLCASFLPAPLPENSASPSAPLSFTSPTFSLRRAPAIAISSSPSFPFTSARRTLLRPMSLSSCLAARQPTPRSAEPSPLVPVTDSRLA